MADDPRLSIAGVSMIDLGSLGGTFTEPRELNGPGHVVGVSTTASGVYRAFIWTPAAGMQDLDSMLPDPYGVGGFTYPDGINDAGKVVYRKFHTLVALPGSGVAADLGHDFNASDINNAGQVAGGSGFTGGPRVALVWTPDASGTTGAFRNLGTFGFQESFGFAINEGGHVAGMARSGATYRAFRWKPDGTFTILPTLGGNECIAFALNEADDAAGRCTTPTGDYHAVRWPAAGGIQDLGTLGSVHSEAHGINDRGEVIGFRFDSFSAGDTRAFLWTAGAGMQDLATDGPWRSRAVAINAAGQVAGWTDFSGTRRAGVLWRVGNLPPQASMGGPYFAMPATPVPFDASGSTDPNGDPLAFAWDFDGDGTDDATGVSATHAYPASGDYTARLIVTDGRGGADTVTAQVSVGASVAGISINGSYAGQEGGQIAFSSAGSETAGGGTAKWYRWDFGDGTRASSRFRTTPFDWTKRYADNGTYTVTLTVVDIGGTVRVARTTAVVTSSAPRAVLGGATFIKEGSAPHVYFHFVTDSSSADRAAGYTYAFDCGTGYWGPWQSSSSSACPVVADEVPGRLTLRARVRDKDGAVREYSRLVSVFNAAPVIAIDDASLTGANATVRFRFTDAGAGDAPWQWRVVWGDGTATGGSSAVQDVLLTVDHTYASPRTSPAYVEVRDRDGKRGRSPDLPF